MTSEETALEGLMQTSTLVEPILSHVKSPHTLYRLDGGSKRYYYYFNNDGQPIFRTSITSFLRGVLPISPFLVQWYAKYGLERAYEMMDESAEYGTFFHIEAAEFLKTGECNLDTIRERLLLYKPQKKVFIDHESWASRAQNDLTSFAHMCRERELRPIAIEMPLSSNTGLAGTLDIACEMTFNRKRIWALIDMKSGRKGFYKDHELQLHVQKLIWNENFPDIPISHVFNFAPVELPAKTMQYKLTNQTDCDSKYELPGLIQVFQAGGFKNKPRDVKKFSGILKLGEDPSGCMREVTIEDHILSIFKN